MHTNFELSLQPNFMSCISLNMHFLQSLLKLKIVIIKVRTHLLYIYLVLNVVFILRCIVKAVQDDISSKLFAYDCVTLY